MTGLKYMSGNIMDKSRQLIIRACRSLNPRRRVLRVHKHFYIQDKTKTQQSKQILHVLTEICEDFNLITVDKFITNVYVRMAIYPSVHIDGAEMDYEKFVEASIEVLISKIRLSKNSIFKGLTIPATFRKNK